MKKILSITLAAVLLLALATTAYAASIYITSASNGISKSGTTITVSQSTYTNTTATKIKQVKYLQRYVSGSWVTYSTSTTYAYNTSSFSNAYVKSVTSGYTYRVITYHYAYDGTTLVDAIVRTSSSVYVG